jgi:hypothetical protein
VVVEGKKMGKLKIMKGKEEKRKWYEEEKMRKEKEYLDE